MKDTKVLVVDDDIDLGRLIDMALCSLGYEVHFQNSLTGITGIIEQFIPHIIVLDVEVGKQNGIEAAEEIVKVYPEIPVIFISSHNDIDYINRGLSMGGVSYLKKPFEIIELAAYIQRFTKDHSEDNSVSIGLYTLELGNQRLVFKEEVIKYLSPFEKNALLLLIKNKNRVISRELFIQELWNNQNGSGNVATLNNLISKLRKLIARDPQLTIETIKYQGYRLRYKE